MSQTTTASGMTRKLLWMRQPQDFQQTLPEAFGLASMMAPPDSCCDHGICQVFCICDELDICVSQQGCSLCNAYA